MTFEEIQKAKILGSYNLFPKENSEVIIKAKELSESPKFKKVMDEWKNGTLTTPSGDKVTDQKQALAIAFSEAQKVEKSQYADTYQNRKLGRVGQQYGNYQDFLNDEDKRNKDAERKRYSKVPETIEHEGETYYLVSDKDKDSGTFYPRKDENGKYHYESGLGKVLKKSEENLGGEIVKGGEGSRGGKVIGHTKSGKPIYDSHGHEAHKDFTPEEHREASKLHDKIAKEKETASREKDEEISFLGKEGGNISKIRSLNDESNNLKEEREHHSKQADKHFDSSNK